MGLKSRKYLVSGAAIGALMSMSYGFIASSFNSSKDFAIVDMGWCANAANIYDCGRSRLYAGLCNAASFGGSAIGSLFISLTAKFGRRISFMIINWLFITGSILSASSVNFGMLFVGRLLCGMGIGLNGAVPLFLIEICHPKSRKFFTFIFSFFITFGQLFTIFWQLLHLRIVDNFDKDGNSFALSNLDKFVWRSSQGWPILFGLTALFLIHFVFNFDTPYELIEKGRTAEARDVIEKLHGAEAVDEVFDEFDRDCEIAKSTPNIPLHKALSNPKYRKIIIHSFVLSFLQASVGYAVFTSNSTKLFMQMIGRSMKATVSSTLLFLINFLANVVLMCIIGKAGRKTFLVGGIGFSTVFMALASFSKPIGKDAKWVPIVSIIGSFGFIIGFAFGLGGITWVYLAEVYPPECKNGAMSAAVFVNCAFAAANIFGYEYLISYSEILTNCLLFIISLFGLVYVILFIRETKGVALGKAYD